MSVSKMSISDLPDEILLHIAIAIVSDCHGTKPHEPLTSGAKSILHFRAACRRFNKIAADALAQEAARGVEVPFRTINITLQAQHLYALVTLTEDSLLRHVVHGVCVRLKPLDMVEVEVQSWCARYGHQVLDSTMSYSLQDLGLYRKHWNPHYDFVLYYDVTSNEHVGLVVERYNLYRRNLDAQRVICNHKGLVEILQAARTAMPNLSEFSTYEQNHNCPEANLTEKQRCEGLMYCRLRYSEIVADQHYDLLWLALKVFSPCHKIRTLTLTGLNYSVFCSESASSNLTNFRTMAKNIRTLSVSLYVARRTLEHADLAPRNFVRFFNRFIYACYVQISHVPHANEIHYLEPVFDLLQYCHLPRLYSIGLRGVDMRTRAFLTFLFSHHQTMRHLVLDPLPVSTMECHFVRQMLTDVQEVLELESAQVVLEEGQCEDCDWKWAETWPDHDKLHTAGVCAPQGRPCRRSSAKDVGGFLLLDPVTAVVEDENEATAGDASAAVDGDVAASMAMPPWLPEE